MVAEYVAAVRRGERPNPPRVLIEVHLSEGEGTAILRGSINHERTDSIGVSLEITFNDDYAPEYAAMLDRPDEFTTLPTEYYCAKWCSFAGAGITGRSMPIGVSYIDATTIRLQSGTDFYLQNIINSGLEPKERVALAVAYRNLKHEFSAEEAIQAINAKLTQRKGAITDKELTISVDVSQKANWETSLVPHLDDLPFQFVGKGEQSALKIMLALERGAGDAHVILIEEPENHLSFSNMQKLIHKIAEKCEGKQIIITTHSAYVMNKLGLDKAILLHDSHTTSLSKLPADTEKYFKKLSGYDTLRIILAKRSILVEGPSDELIVKRAYYDQHGKWPSDDAIDVINVRGLSFPRFLDIAKELKKSVAVVTDNDGNHQKNIVERYASYTSEDYITICADEDEDAPTLEPQLVKHNDFALLNSVLGTAHADMVALTNFMVGNKTEAALRILESSRSITYPPYIRKAL